MPFEVVKEQCNMESGDTGQAMVYKLEGEQRVPFACHADEASAYAAIAAIEAADEAKQIDKILNQMADLMVDEEMKEFNLGDMVHFVDGDGDGFGIIENLDAEANVYTIRVYATAGEQMEPMEPTDQLVNLPLESIHDAESYLEGELVDGDFVKWKSAGGEAQGKVIQVSDSEPLSVPDSEFTVEASAEDPAALIEVYERVEGGWRSSGVIVGHRFSTLSKIEPLEEAELPKRRIIGKFKQVEMDVTEVDNTKVGVIEGFASTYGNTDLGGDVVEKGAFKQTLLHKQGVVPLLLDHGYNTRDVAGVAILEDQEKGLFMKAEMPLDDPTVAATYNKIKFMLDRGAKMGLSIGYDTIKSMPGADGTRLLKEVALHEVSITPFPMNTEAQIMAAKSRKSSLKRKQALWQKSITRRKTVKRPQDDGFQSLADELRSLITEIKSN